MVPLVRTVAEARNIASYSRFPPSGTRGLGSPFSMEKFHPDLTQVQYFQQANDATLVILQIETAEALKSVAEIAAVPGVDALLVGPFDLGNSIGHPVLKPEYDVELEEAIMKIHKAAQAAGKWTAIYCGSGASGKTDHYHHESETRKADHSLLNSPEVRRLGLQYGQHDERCRGSKARLRRRGRGCERFLCPRWAARDQAGRGEDDEQIGAAFVKRCLQILRSTQVAYWS